MAQWMRRATSGMGLARHGVGRHCRSASVASLPHPARLLSRRMLELLFLLVRGFLFGFRARRELALENLVLRHQLQVVLRTKGTPRLRRLMAII